MRHAAIPWDAPVVRRPAQRHAHALSAGGKKKKSLASIQMPTPQPAQFVETSSLEINYLGWARKASSSNRKGSTHEE